jgi:hypothetical protein
MVTTKEKYPCPVCGEMISKQGVAGHNKSKKHLAALEQQKTGTDKIKQPPEEPKTQKLDIKPVPSIMPKIEVKHEQDTQTEDEEWRGFFGD